jgi:hypothetical protein
LIFIKLAHADSLFLGLWIANEGGDPGRIMLAADLAEVAPSSATRSDAGPINGVTSDAFHVKNPSAGDDLGIAR